MTKVNNYLFFSTTLTILTTIGLKKYANGEKSEREQRVYKPRRQTEDNCNVVGNRQNKRAKKPTGKKLSNYSDYVTYQPNSNSGLSQHQNEDKGMNCSAF